jgi:hypothetical protein
MIFIDLLEWNCSTVDLVYWATSTGAEVYAQNNVGANSHGAYYAFVDEEDFVAFKLAFQKRIQTTSTL